MKVVLALLVICFSALAIAEDKPRFAEFDTHYKAERTGDSVAEIALLNDYALAAKSWSTSEQVIYLSRIANAHLLNLNVDKAYQYISEADSKMAFDDTSSVATFQFYMTLGDIEFERVSPDVGCQAYSRAHTLINRVESKGLRGMLLYKLSRCGDSMENANNRIALLRAAIDLVVQTDNERLLSNIYSELGYFFQTLRNHVVSIEYNELSLELSRKLELVDEIKVMLLNLAISYQALGETDEAKALLNELDTITTTPNWKFHLHRVYAELYLRLNENGLALNQARLAVENSSGLEDSAFAMLNNIHYATALLSIEGEHAARRLIDQKKLTDETMMNSAIKIQYAWLVLQARLSLYDGNQAVSNKWVDQLVAFQFAADASRKDQIATMISADFDAEQKDLRLQLLEKTHSLQVANEDRKELMSNMLQFAVVGLLAIVALVVTVLISVWRSRTHLKAISETDELTSVFNRRAILERYSNGEHSRQLISLVLFDLDHFKRVNDEYGHQTGDLVLKHTVEVAASCLRPDDEIGRIGGEEFLLLLSHDSPEDAHAVTERVRESLAETPLRVAGREDITVTASFAFITVDAAKTPSFKSLYKHLDDGLYRAKNGGRNLIEKVDLAEHRLVSENNRVTRTGS